MLAAPLVELLIIRIGLGLAFSYAQVWRKRKQEALAEESEGVSGETTTGETCEQIEEMAKEGEEGPPEEEI